MLLGSIPVSVISLHMAEPSVIPNADVPWGIFPSFHALHAIFSRWLTIMSVTELPPGHGAPGRRLLPTKGAAAPPPRAQHPPHDAPPSN